MIQNLGEKAKAELVKLYQQIYTRGTRGKIADRHSTEKAEKLVWTYPARQSPADSDRRQNDWETGGRKTKNENDRLG